MRALLALLLAAAPAPEPPPDFVVVPLGVAGGLAEGNLSSYLLAAPGEAGMVFLDAGATWAGLEEAWEAVSGLELAGDGALDPVSLRRDEVRAVLVSHAHLDHVAGLVVGSTDDGPKAVVGLPTTIDAIRDHLFNWTVWPNFGDEGREPRLGLYSYVRLEDGEAVALGGTPFTVEAMALAHGGVPSTLFIVSRGEAVLAYFGDTGPDAVEGGGALCRVWERLAPLARDGRLKGMLLEASFDDSRPDSLLFGHLTPAWMLEELRAFAALVSPDDPAALEGLRVVVTSVKPVPGEPFGETRGRILRQLEEGNDLGVEFVLPFRGAALPF